MHFSTNEIEPLGGYLIFLKHARQVMESIIQKRMPKNTPSPRTKKTTRDKHIDINANLIQS